jgi:3-methyladenine DNA glycosylase/8-oxoguanine DNA glycosylase
VVAEVAYHPIDAPRSLGQTLAAFRSGSSDPTTKLERRRFRRATLTPDGPGTLQLTWTRDPAPVGDDGLDAAAWGPGADWLIARVDRLTGAHDRPVAFWAAHPVVARGLAATRAYRIGASGTLFHELLPVVIAQRITAGEARHQWVRLCRALGEAPPGPAEVVGGLRLPPNPAALYRRPAWWFHPLGIETARARTLVELARHPSKLFAWADLPPTDTYCRLTKLRGVGPWTAGSVIGPALGDPDAVAVGDYHFPSAVAWALAGEPRADDDRMLELLAPYAGQRGRVLRAILRASGPAPKFGPRQRILPMARW